MNTRAPTLSDSDILSDLTSSVEDSLGMTDKEVDTENKTIDKSSHYSRGVTTTVEGRAEELLGAGVSAESVASALGVSASRISQLMADQDFANRVVARRFESLQKHNERDDKYDTIEDALLDKLQRAVPLMMKPETILKAINVVNNAKRRGSSAPQAVSASQTIVNLNIPTVIKQKFVVNSENQVVKAGEQQLVTMQSGTLLNKINRDEQQEAKAIAHTSSQEGTDECVTTGNRESYQN